MASLHDACGCRGVHVKLAASCAPDSVGPSYGPPLRNRYGGRLVQRRHRAVTVPTKRHPISAARSDTKQADAEATRQLKAELLLIIKNTDSGLDMRASEQGRATEIIENLAHLGSQASTPPLEDKRIFGNYSVEYSPPGPQQRGQRKTSTAAGGRFRTLMGRKLFQTTGLYQSIMRPDVVANKVAFKLLGFIPGSVCLRGRLQPEGDRKDTVRVRFQPPVLSFGDLFRVKIGPTSSVVLTTTYLDDELRLGRGSRGSLFVFRKSKEADAAGMQDAGLGQKSFLSSALLAAMAGLFVYAGWSLWNSTAIVAKIASIFLWFITAVLFYVLWNGGTDGGD